MALTITSLIGTGPLNTSSTGALTPTAGVSISSTATAGGYAGQVTVCVEILQLTAAKTFSLQLEASTNGFTNTVAQWILQGIGQQGEGGTTFTQGDYTQSTDKSSVVARQLLPAFAANYLGVANAVCRLNLLAIDSGGSLTFNAWLEH